MMQPEDIVRLTDIGHWARDTNRYGVKGQLARVKIWGPGITDIELLSPRSDQHRGAFHIDENRVEKL